MDQIKGERKKLHNEELNDLYFSPNISRMIKLKKTRFGGISTRMRKTIGGYRFWWWNLGMRPLGRPRFRW
jgi:hypothetical protein